MLPDPTARAALERAYDLEEQGDLEAALEACEEALALDPEDAEAHNFHGILLDALGRSQEALDAYREAVRLDPGFEDARQNLEEAETELRAPVGARMPPSLHADDAWGYLELAYTYDNEGDTLTALQACDAALALDPELAEAHNLRGLVLDALGRADEALAAYQEAVRLDPDFEDALENLRDAEQEAASRRTLYTAERYLQQGMLEAARETCHTALESLPQLAHAHYVHGQILEQLQRPAEALDAYREAYALDATLDEASAAILRLELADNERLTAPTAEARQSLEQAYRHDEAGDTEAALTACEAALALAPAWAEAHNLRGILLEASGRSEEALAAYARALELVPEFSDAQRNHDELQGELQARPYLERAQAYIEQELYIDAIQECGEALALCPTWAEAHFLYGWLLEQLKKFNGARRAYQKTLELAPEHQGAQQHLALIEEFIYGEALVVVGVYGHPAQAYVAKGRLDVEGIETFIADENTAGLVGGGFVGGIKVLVRASDEDVAREILEDSDD